LCLERTRICRSQGSFARIRGGERTGGQGKDQKKKKKKTPCEVARDKSLIWRAGGALQVQVGKKGSSTERHNEKKSARKRGREKTSPSEKSVSAIASSPARCGGGAKGNCPEEAGEKDTGEGRRGALQEEEKPCGSTEASEKRVLGQSKRGFRSKGGVVTASSRLQRRTVIVPTKQAT